MVKLQIGSQSTILSSDDEFDDSELDYQDMVDVLDDHEKQNPTPFQSPLKGKERADSHQPLDIYDESPRLPAEPTSSDASISAALWEAEASVVGRNHTQSHSIMSEDEKVITLTRAELEAIKTAAFAAGQRHVEKRIAPFPFLSLPAELRLVFYSHYFADRNPITAGESAAAVPARLTESNHCCAPSNTWCNTKRPWISTTLLLTCKQIYHEARDDFLYKNRLFHAQVGRFDEAFRRISPHLRFWQHIQHLSLEITPRANLGARYETGNLIVHLTALLRGGQHLRSFKLLYKATGRVEAISRFRELSVRRDGVVSITQVWKDWYEMGEKEEHVRREKLERLLFGILGCASYDAPPYDFVTSTTTLDVEVELDMPSYETYMTISTSND